MRRFRFPAAAATDDERLLRREVREFVQHELTTGGFVPAADSWVSAPDPVFSRKLGARGWLGVTWPREYGGQARAATDRLIITEELLAAGAPVAAHWVADRQSGPQLLKCGSEQQKLDILPRIAAGECFFAIGMSEPQAGSDLAAVVTRAQKNADGWRLNGRKIWSTGAHLSQYMIVLARTSPAQGRDRHIGLSQFLVELALPGISISGIADLAGSEHFNETLFDDVQLPPEALLGEEGRGWSQVMGELAMERSGPERFLTTFALLQAALAALPPLQGQAAGIAGRLIAHLSILRRMSRGIALQLGRGESPDTEAALVKELGNRLESDIVDGVRALLAQLPPHQRPASLQSLLDGGVLRLPSHSLRGGTTEIMRGIIARQLGVR